MGHDVMTDKEDQFYINHYKQLEGKTINKVLIDESTDNFGTSYGFECTDGTVIWVVQDVEGNPGGFLEIDKTGK